MDLENRKYLEKKIVKYVIATLDNPTFYLHKTLQKKEYTFTDDIESATKAANKKVAEIIKEYYKMDTGDTSNLVIIPVEVSYCLINEQI